MLKKAKAYKDAAYHYGDLSAEAQSAAIHYDELGYRCGNPDDTAKANQFFEEAEKWSELAQECWKLYKRSLLGKWDTISYYLSKVFRTRREDDLPF